jgi:hypothetical protein
MCNQPALLNTVYVLERVENLVSMFTTSPFWNDIINRLNEQDADYSDWSDLEIVIWFIKNFPEELKEFDLDLKLNIA